MAYQVRNLDHFLKFRLARFQLSEINCTCRFVLAIQESKVLHQTSSCHTQVGVVMPMGFIHYPSLDFCPDEIVTLPSPNGDSSLDMRISWPLTPLGETVTIPCPCRSLTLGSSVLVATRECRGNFDSGAVWRPPQDSPCNFSTTARIMCTLAEVSQKNHTLTQVLGYLSVHTCVVIFHCY